MEFSVRVIREDASAATTTDDDASSPADAVTLVQIRQCLAQAEALQQQCNDSNAQWIAIDCKESRSDCANWHVGCFAPFVPGGYLSEGACATPGFFDCVIGPLSAYVACAGGCNAQQDRRGCAARCSQTMAAADGRCRADPFSARRDEASASASARIETPSPSDSEAGASRSPRAEVTHASGRVEVRRIDAAQWELVQQGVVFFGGEQIRTTSRSRMEVRLAGGNILILRLAPNSQITLSERAADQDRRPSAVRLSFGSIYLRLRSLVYGEEPSVLTDDSIAGARGTEFLLRRDAAARTDDYLVAEGSVEVRGTRSGRALLSPGQRVRVVRGVVGEVSQLEPGAWARAVAGIQGAEWPPLDESAGVPGASTEPRDSIVVFADTFDSENQSSGILNYRGFNQWTVSRGEVDLAGDGFWDMQPDPGLYVDLDGTGGGSRGAATAGTLESREALHLEPGDYVLRFELGGNVFQDDPNTVTVRLGDLFSEELTLGREAPQTAFRSFEREIRVERATRAHLVFEHHGGDWDGLFLDNVELSKVVR